MAGSINTGMERATNQKIISIDPGMSGALAMIEFGTVLDLIDMPLIEFDRERHINGPAIATWLCGHSDVDCIVIEKPITTGKAKTTLLKQGANFGRLWGICDGLGFRVELVHPLAWKRRLGATKADIPAGFKGDHKDYARALARGTWPEIADKFKRVCDDGRAEACLIGLDWMVRNP